MSAQGGGGRAMTRTAVDNTIARLKAWVSDMSVGPACYHAGCFDSLDDLEDLRQHDETQAATVERLRAALVAAAEHHEEQADLWNSDNEFGDDETGEYHAERARVLRAAAEGQS